MRPTFLFLALLAAIAGRVSAQQVSGTLRDSVTQLPVPGAVVLLYDAGGMPLARGTTDQRGEFRLAASAAAARMRVLRLGFRPWETALVPARMHEPMTISLVAIPLLLETVRTTVAANCPRRRDRDAALALLEQVRSGLLATIVARAQHRALMTRLRFERRLGDRDRILDQQVRRDVASVDRPYRAARNALEFVQQGFRDDRTNTFFAPEAETLIDEGFAAGYCFHLMPAERTRPNQVGLGFRAARRRPGRIDIEGALWVDSLARALTDLEVRYVGLHPILTELRPGGHLSFREMTNGVPLIDRWSLRLVGAQPDTGDGDGTRTVRVGPGQPLRLQLQEMGGELAEARWPDGTTWKAPLGVMRLHVVTGTGRPAAGTVVRLTGTDYAGTTDSAGIVELSSLLPGPYTASVTDPQLSTLGVLLSTSMPFVAVRGATVPARVEVVTAQDHVAGRCRAKGTPLGSAYLLARVVTPDGQSAGGARWSISSASGELLADAGQVGTDGLLYWCELWPGEDVEVAASLGERNVRMRTVLNRELTILRLVLPAAR